MSFISAKSFVAILSLMIFSGSLAYAQISDDEIDFPEVEESAPQEPPYTQNPAEINEFENAEKQPAEILQVPESETPRAQVAEPTAPVAAPNTEDSAVVRREKTRGGKSRVEKIHHPLAAKGLLKIEKDGTYVYKTEDSSHDKSASFRFGLLQPPQIQGPAGDFKSMYSSSNIPVVFFDYEWQPFSSFGKLGVQIGVGFFTAQGAGHFLTADASGSTEAQEKYTFLAFPINLGAVYRLEWMKRQWFAPYVAGGGTYFAIAETRDDDKAPKFVGSPGVYGAAGGMFNITALDRDTAFTMSSEYGISNFWLTLEGRYIKSLNEDLDFTSAVFNVGFAVDY